LLYDDSVIDQPRLQVPHPHLAERSFVLYPLAELNPQLTLPDGTPLQRLLDRCPMGSLQRVGV
jgi:2-amino-4-hydroxy-6-hydroxymethyldihydropteridine diphosphokinase